MKTNLLDNGIDQYFCIGATKVEYSSSQTFDQKDEAALSAYRLKVLGARDAPVLR
jgi:hypothetical protein